MQAHHSRTPVVVPYCQTSEDWVVGIPGRVVCTFCIGDRTHYRRHRSEPVIVTMIDELNGFAGDCTLRFRQ